MRLSEALFQADALRPNAIGPETKKAWLWRLEMELAEMMDEEPPIFSEFDDPELLMPDPFSNIYPLYLAPYIDFVNEETDLYQLDTIESNAVLSDAKKWWRRNHKKKCDTKIKGVFW